VKKAIGGYIKGRREYVTTLRAHQTHINIKDINLSFYIEEYM